MTAVTDQLSKSAHRRKRALDPYLKRLRRLSDEHAARFGRGRRLELQIGGRPWHVEWWVLAGGLYDLETGDEDPERAPLLSHAAALQLKIAADRVRLDQRKLKAGHALYEVQAELMLDTAMGMALMREIQTVIDDEVGRGRLGPAKQWTKLKNELNASISELKQLLEASERQRAESLSDRLTDQPRATGGDTQHYRKVMRRLDELEDSRKRRVLSRKRAREALDNLPSRTEMLVAVLGLGVAIWLGFVVLPQRLRDRPTVLTAEDLPRTDALVGFDARPPSLYVTVDDALWAGLDGGERTKLVQGFEGVLHRTGYSGALFKTASGRPVAQWLTLTGARILEPSEGEPREPSSEEPPPDDQLPGAEQHPAAGRGPAQSR